jgi:hypothetical protein
LLEPLAMLGFCSSDWVRWGYENYFGLVIS